jgi:rubrerythrin
MIVYFSGGGGGKRNPERVLHERACLMLTFYKSRKNVENRFLVLHNSRMREFDKKYHKKCRDCGALGFIVEGHDPPEQSRCPSCDGLGFHQKKVK